MDFNIDKHILARKPPKRVIDLTMKLTDNFYRPIKMVQYCEPNCQTSDKQMHVHFLHYENTPIQLYWNFTTKKWKFSDKKNLIFFIFLHKT